MKKILLAGFGLSLSFGCMAQFEPDLNNNPAFLGVSYVSNAQFETSLINMGFKKKIIKDPRTQKNSLILLENKNLGYEINKIGENSMSIELTNLSTIDFSEANANLNKVVNKLVELYGESYNIEVELTDVKRTNSGVILSEENIERVWYYWRVNGKLMWCKLGVVNNEYYITVLISK